MLGKYLGFGDRPLAMFLKGSGYFSGGGGTRATKLLIRDRLRHRDLGYRKHVRRSAVGKSREDEVVARRLRTP